MRRNERARHYSPAPVGSSGVSQLLTVVASGVAGLVVGSFLNVVAYRLPRRMSVVQPPSHCPACATQLTLVDLVPVASWLWLRGHCRHCRAPISWRYPVVELATGVLCAAAAAALASVWPLPSVALLCVCALAASIIDADGLQIPVALVVAASVAALSLLPITAAVGDARRIPWAALGAVLVAVVAFVAGRPGAEDGWARIAILSALGLSAGWLWAWGGVIVAGWIVAATVAARLAARGRAAFAVLAAGSILAVLASAIVVRPY